MKFIVEVKDFWLEEEELTESLKSHIVVEVTKQIKDSIKEQVDNLTNEEIKVRLDSELQTRVNVHIEEFLKVGKIKDRYSRDTNLTVDEFLAKSFKDNNDVIIKHIENQAKIQATKIKDSYDLLFASQIVNKLNEQGMLKEGLADLLFNKKENG